MKNNKIKKYNKARQNLINMYLESLKEDVIPWEKEWVTDAPINAITGTKYRGVNNLILSYIANSRGYKENRWCTYDQMIKNKCHFNQSAVGQGVSVEFWGKYNIKEKKVYSFTEYEKIVSNDTEKEADFKPILRSYTVFNVDLIDGIPEQIKKVEEINTADFISNIIENLEVNYCEKGNEAYYDIASDTVVVPPTYKFKNKYGYYSTQLHELAHSTAHSNRLDRNINNKFGTPEYAKEELRAEISSSFLMQKLKLKYDDNHLKNHKAYIQNWIKIIENQPDELFKAIKDADKIVDYLEENSIEKEKNLNGEINLERELEHER